MKPIRLVLADDHTLVRSGIRMLLNHIRDVEVVGEAHDGRDAIATVKALKPDVVLMDISMSGMNGLEATGRIVKEFANVRVLILSMHSDEAYVLRALRAGASGYLLKDAASSELEFALQTVAKGKQYLSPSISKGVIDSCLKQLPAGSAAEEKLTPRQREILQLIAEGHSTKEIAYLLNISGKTVETHRAQLMARLDIRDVAGLVRYAMREGIITPNE
ncbi:MAG: response regulator [Candidatus Sumerlaeaceae bacterium]